MHIVCRANNAKALPPKHFVVFRGDSEQTIFHVSVGAEYFVYAMAHYNSAMILLLVDDTGKPNWYPIELFSVTHPKLPPEWFFSTSVANEHGVDAIWGYQHLVSDRNHYEALIERDPDALRVFEEEQRKAQANNNFGS
jgi:hypothetical protein